MQTELNLLLILWTFPIDSVAFSLTNHSRFKREEECGVESPFSLPDFHCKTGGCIPGEEECDGIGNCNDGSDEGDNCKNIDCSRLFFRCAYGACIKKEKECDGWLDCFDGSDEKNCPSVQPCDNQREFRCKSGQCIDINFKCDGIAQCDDFSDEIRETCFDRECPGFLYKCKYGACAKGGAECNGVLDCFDGSDEDPSVCEKNPPQVAPERPQEQGKCVLPHYPQFGQWSIFGPGASVPGQLVDTGTILRFSCEQNYKLQGNSTIFCEHGRWSANPAYCSEICPARVSSPTLKVTCLYKYGEVENCTEAVNGTVAQFKCVTFYEDLNLKLRSAHICANGRWDQPEPNCKPICGQKSVQPTTLIIKGKTVKKGKYPWQIALYTKSDKELICGGSLISQRVALTAAHCVTDDITFKLNSKDDYEIAVGKYFRDYYHKEDKKAQFSDVHEIFIPEEYEGFRQHFLADIAVIITKVTFTLSEVVQPVCLDTGHHYKLKERKIGYVTGWGFTAENKNESPVLKELKVPFIGRNDCKSKLLPDYENFLTHDKMCAGFLNKGVSVCRGDSGGGLVFKYDDRYYLFGVVSLSPTSLEHVGGCNSMQYGLYTKVSKYINNFILPKLAIN